MALQATPSKMDAFRDMTYEYAQALDEADTGHSYSGKAYTDSSATLASLVSSRVLKPRGAGAAATPSSSSSGVNTSFSSLGPGLRGAFNQQRNQPPRSRLVPPAVNLAPQPTPLAPAPQPTPLAPAPGRGQQPPAEAASAVTHPAPPATLQADGRTKRPVKDPPTLPPSIMVDR